jgi:hypothetical protein
MRIHHRLLLALLATAGAFPAATQAQFQIDWYTIDEGGGASAGGAFSLTGTIGQPDAGDAQGGGFDCAGGFWAGGSAGSSCYANCDQSTVSPALNANDFQCFLNAFASGLVYANCDGSSVAPILNANDFQCFLNSFALGCS